MDMDMEIVDNNDVEVPIDPDYKRRKTSLSTEFQHSSGDTSSLNSFFISEGKTLLEQSGSRSASDHGSSEGRSVVTTVSTKSDESETKSTESDVSSPPPKIYGDEETDDEYEFPEGVDGQAYKAAMLGLESYNAKNKGAEYEIVTSVTSSPVFLGDYFGVHANFFARRSGDDQSDAKLFYVEAIFSTQHATRCEIMEPQPFSLGETPPKAEYDGVIFHPKGVACVCGSDPSDFDLGNAYSSSLLYYNYEKSLELANAQSLGA